MSHSFVQLNINLLKLTFLRFSSYTNLKKTLYKLYKSKKIFLQLIQLIFKRRKLNHIYIPQNTSQINPTNHDNSILNRHKSANILPHSIPPSFLSFFPPQRNPSSPNSSSISPATPRRNYKSATSHFHRLLTLTPRLLISSILASRPRNMYIYIYTYTLL